MRKNRFTILMLILSCIAFSVVSLAAEKKCTGNQLIVGTGLESAVYSKMTKTLVDMRSDLVCERLGSTGGIDNVMDLLQRKIDVGIVQADVLEYMRRTEPMVNKKIRSLVALHPNYLHIFVLRNGLIVKKNFLQIETVKIRNIRELKGKPVAAFSSAPVTLKLINERLGLNLKIREVASKEEGFRLLQRGEVYAFFATGGRYIPWVDEMDTKVYTLVNMSIGDIQTMQAPYFPGKITYRKLGVQGVNVIGVRNEMVCWNYTGIRSAQLLELRQFIKDNLIDIQEMRESHPAWQEIEPRTLDDVSWQMYTGR